MKRIAVIIFLTVAHSFYLNPVKHAKAAWFGTSSTEEAIARIHQEYENLQKILLDDLFEKKDRAAAEDVAELILEKALQAAALQRYKQQEIIDAAQSERKAATEEMLRAHCETVQAHNDVVAAEREARMLETIDAAYEDLERLREKSRYHAAQHLEKDSKDIEIENAFLELEAEAIQIQALEILDELKLYEAQLKESLKDLREIKNGKLLEEWKHPHREYMVHRIKDLLHSRSQEG